MRSRQRWSLALAALAALLSPASAKTDQNKVQGLCPRIQLVGPELDFNEVEKRLVCGDESSEGWKKIPLNQAQYFMRAFLQRRGYHYPRFEAENEVLTVSIGTMTRVTKLEGRGLETLIDLGKKRGVVGHVLTPAELDKLKTDIATRLQEQGYACPALELAADARTGVVTVTADPGIYYILTYIRAPKVEGVDPGVFNRFQAHQYGYPFDVRLLNLTSDRTVQEALFQSAYYDVACTTTGLHVTQRIVEAKPRLVKIGFGIDSEGYARGRAQWRHSRMGYRASSAEATLYASFREQQFDALAHYYLRPSDRLNLVPSFTLRRDNETNFEIVEQQASLAPAWSWDNVRLHLEVMGGPAFESYNTIRGAGPANDDFFAFNTRINLTSHLYEYYQRDPRIGWQGGFQTSSRVQGAYSSISAHRLRAYGQKLWNLGHFDPPWFVLATRGWAGTLAVADPKRALQLLPPTRRFFIGGDADLRGAQRQELPSDGAGFLSAVYGGVELRVNDVLPYKIQPLVFADAAMGGQRSFQLDRDIYYSPGAGARWVSPVGSFRFTAARGLVARRTGNTPSNLPHWQYFVSFGQEF